MVPFVCTPLRETDDRGKVSASGLFWREGTTGRSFGTFLGLWLIVAFSVLVCAVILIIASTPGAFWLWTATVPFALLIVYLLRIIFSKAPERSLLFRHDGSVVAPQGLPRHPQMRELPFTQEDISSIEVAPNLSGLVADQTKTVRIITRFGQNLPVGFALHEEHAQEVAVRLTLALKDMRSAAGETARTATAGDVID